MGGAGRGHRAEWAHAAGVRSVRRGAADPQRRLAAGAYLRQPFSGVTGCAVGA